MRSINKVVLIGNLTRDPEMRETPNGQKVVTFGIATNREWVTKDGRKQSSTEFHDLVAWARLADICEQHLCKGKLVYVEGYLKTRSWDTPEGIKKFRTEIVVQDMIMLDKKGQGHSSSDYSDSSEEEYDDIESSDVTTDSTNSNDNDDEQQTVSVGTPKQQDRPAENPIEKTDSAETNEPAKEEKSEKEPVAAGQLDIDSDLGL